MAEDKKQLTPEQKKKRRMIFVVIIIILVLIIGTVIAVSVIRSRKNKKALEEAEKKKKLAGEQASSSEAASKPEGNDNFPLEEGSEGENVLYLQRAINRILLPGKTKLKEDGKFGPETYLGVITNVGTKYYPVTTEHFNKILTTANQAAQGK